MVEIIVDFDAKFQLVNTYNAFGKYLKNGSTLNQIFSPLQISRKLIFRVGRRSYIIF